MKLIKQILFKIEASKTQYNSTFFVEANNFEEALVIAKEVTVNHYKNWVIKSIVLHAPLFKSLTKTITVEL